MPKLPDMPDMSRDVMNDFTFWFPKIANIQNTGLKIPRSVAVQVPVEVQQAFYMEKPDDFKKIQDFVDGTLIPVINTEKLGLVFLKNGAYSHKFDARSACLPIMSDLAHAVLTIMNEAMLRCGFQYDGTNVIVARERITYDPRKTPCIYNGLPFRPEYRVFYDFDKKAVLYTKDYWDKEYVRANLHDLTDQIVYDAWYDNHIKAEYDKNQAHVAELVAEAMAQVSGLNGPWSVDVMQDEYGNFWLIDMAVAEMSAYWDEELAKSGGPA